MKCLAIARRLGPMLTIIASVWLTIYWCHVENNRISRQTMQTATDTFSAVAISSPSSSPVGCTTGIPCDRYDDIVDFRIIVITYSRTKSLMRLLATLDDLVLDGHKAALEIWIDVDKNGSANGDTLAAARSFKWKKGVTRVHLQSRNAGIMGQWIDTWRPRSDSNEIGLILEDDLIVSPMAFRWLKHVHREMKNNIEFAGATVAEQTSLLATKHRGPLVGPRNDTIFMYKGFGTWGFSPHLEHWRRFQDWFHLHEPSVKPLFRPYVNVPECLPNIWYKKFEVKGTAHTMWSMWFLRYMHDEQLFCVYINLGTFTRKSNVCLSANMKEPGLHNRGKNAGRATCTLLKDWSEQLVQFPKNVTRLHWDGRPLGSNVYHL